MASKQINGKQTFDQLPSRLFCYKEVENTNTTFDICPPLIILFPPVSPCKEASVGRTTIPGFLSASLEKVPYTISLSWRHGMNIFEENSSKATHNIRHPGTTLVNTFMLGILVKT